MFIKTWLSKYVHWNMFITTCSYISLARNDHKPVRVSGYPMLRHDKPHTIELLDVLVYCNMNFNLSNLTAYPFPT